MYAHAQPCPRQVNAWEASGHYLSAWGKVQKRGDFGGQGNSWKAELQNLHSSAKSPPAGESVLRKGCKFRLGPLVGRNRNKLPHRISYMGNKTWWSDATYLLTAQVILTHKNEFVSCLHRLPHPESQS